MDRETIRHLLLEEFKRNPKTQVRNVLAGVGNLAMEQELVSQPQGWHDRSYDSQSLPHRDQLVAQELIWELIIQGVITPGMNASNMDLPFLRVTEYGEKCMAEKRILPYDYGQYLAEIHTITGGFDSIFTLYLEESVQAFLKGLYLSAVINLGISSERMADLLADDYRATLPTVKQATAFDDAMKKARHASKKFDVLYTRLGGMKNDMPKNLAESLDMVKYLVEIIRRERNDAGHPTGRRFTRDEVLVLLLTFPPHLRAIINLKRWLQSESTTPIA